MPDIGELLQQIGGIALLWLPLVMFTLIIYLLLRTLQVMPRVKTTHVQASARSSISWDNVAGLDEARAEMEEIVDFLRDSKRFERLGAARAEGDPALRAPRHGQDAARQGRRQRVRRELLLAERVCVRRDVRRPRRRADPQALRGGTEERACDRLHRRARRCRHRPNGPRLQPRAGSDAEPAPGRARRLREPATRSSSWALRTGFRTSTRRSSARDGSTGRSSSRLQTLPGGEAILNVHTRGKPLAPDLDLTSIARQTAGLTGAELANIANEAAIFAGREKQDVILQTHFDARARTGRRGPSAAESDVGEGEADPRLPRGRPRAHVVPDGRRVPRPQGDDRRRAAPRSATRSTSPRRSASSTRARSSSTG